MRISIAEYAYPMPNIGVLGDIAMRRGYYVKVHSRHGVGVGLGDACTWPGDDSGHKLLGNELQGVPALTERPTFDAWSLQLQSLSSPARFALESAFLDLQSRRHGLPVARFLNSSARHTIGYHTLIAHPDGLGNGDVIKLKCDGQRQHSIDFVLETAVRLSEARVRLDFNQSGDAPHVNAICQAIGVERIDFIEEPLRADTDERLDAMSKLCAPAALDETLCRADNPISVIDKSGLPWAIVKPMFCGGIVASRQLIDAANTRGMQVCLTTALGSRVEQAMISHLAAAWPVDRTAGLSSVEPSPRAVGGEIVIGDSPGLGVSLD